MCDVCELELGHMERCPLDYGCNDDGEFEMSSISCSVCGEAILPGESYIYDPNGDGGGIICSGCIEELSVSEILDICGTSSVAEIISELSGKLMKAGERY